MGNGISDKTPTIERDNFSRLPKSHSKNLSSTLPAARGRQGYQLNSQELRHSLALSKELRYSLDLLKELRYSLDLLKELRYSLDLPEIGGWGCSFIGRGA